MENTTEAMLRSLIFLIENQEPLMLGLISISFGYQFACLLLSGAGVNRWYDCAVYVVTSPHYDRE